jgi:hypothetical protein
MLLRRIGQADLWIVCAAWELTEVERGPRVAAVAMSTAEDIAILCRRMASLLAGHPDVVQGGALADLLAMWLAGHQVAGDEDATRSLRADLLAIHYAMVRELVPVNARIIGTTP